MILGNIEKNTFVSLIRFSINCDANINVLQLRKRSSLLNSE